MDDSVEVSASCTGESVAFEASGHATLKQLKTYVIAVSLKGARWKLDYEVRKKPVEVKTLARRLSIVLKDRTLAAGTWREVDALMRRASGAWSSGELNAKNEGRSRLTAFLEVKSHAQGRSSQSWVAGPVSPRAKAPAARGHLQMGKKTALPTAAPGPEEKEEEEEYDFDTFRHMPAPSVEAPKPWNAQKAGPGRAESLIVADSSCLASALESLKALGEEEVEEDELEEEEEAPEVSSVQVIANLVQTVQLQGRRLDEQQQHIERLTKQVNGLIMKML